MREQSVLEEIAVDGDDFDEFLRELEVSFCVTLPEDLRHVQTAGDLFDEVTGLRQPSGGGDRCDSAMVFHAIRRAVTAEQDLRFVRPDSRFAALTNERPRELAIRLERETGLRLPPFVRSGRMLLLAAALFISTCVLASYEQFAGALASFVTMVVVYRRDGGIWADSWETVGSLSRAAAIRNIAGLGQRGARDRVQDWWRGYVCLMLDTVQPVVNGAAISPEGIGRETRFKWA